MTRRVVAIVHGIVQGVFFRQTTRAEALRLGVVGTVRNQPDGTVRVVAEAEEGALRELVAWLGHGPERASVDWVDAEWSDPRGDVCDFRIED